jgi:hypothetical protein
MLTALTLPIASARFYNVLTMLPDSMATFIANGDVEGIAACVDAGRRPFKGAGRKSNFRSTTERSLAVQLFPTSMAAVMVTLFDLRETECDEFMAKAQTQCFPQARAARAALLHSAARRRGQPRGTAAAAAGAAALAGARCGGIHDVGV